MANVVSSGSRAAEMASPTCLGAGIGECEPLGQRRATDAGTNELQMHWRTQGPVDQVSSKALLISLMNARSFPPLASMAEQNSGRGDRVESGHRELEAVSGPPVHGETR